MLIMTSGRPPGGFAVLYHAELPDPTGSCILEESKEHVSRMSLSDLFHLDKMETGNQCVKFIDLLVYHGYLELR